MHCNAVVFIAKHAKKCIDNCNTWLLNFAQMKRSKTSDLLVRMLERFKQQSGFEIRSIGTSAYQKIQK